MMGLVAAGLAFAMQEVIGALAGWFNIMTGRIFRVGDRIQMGGVRRDVIDVTLLRTRLMEIGSPIDDGMWIKGRQHTGRVVSISNKKTFTEPVFNYSALFDFIWEELTLPVPFDADWHTAERILAEEAERISRIEGAEEGMRAMRRRFPVPETELRPRVFTRTTSNWMELAARNTPRSVNDSPGNPRVNCSRIPAGRAGRGRFRRRRRPRSPAAARTAGARRRPGRDPSRGSRARAGPRAGRTARAPGPRRPRRRRRAGCPDAR